MTIGIGRRVTYVVGPDGSPLTIADLPTPDTKRWVIRRKGQVVAAVRGGLLSLEEVCRRYRLTVEEFLSWQQSIDRHGLLGLRTTRIQKYRSRGSTQELVGSAEPDSRQPAHARIVSGHEKPRHHQAGLSSGGGPYGAEKKSPEGL